MRFKQLSLSLLSAAVFALAAACGGAGGGGDGGTGCANCTTDEICHPTANVCVQKCEQGTDCDGLACERIGVRQDGGTTTGQFVCQCVNDQQCQDGNAGSSAKCLTQTNGDKLCGVPCSGDGSCPTGEKCENQICVPDGSTGGATCSTQVTCTNPQICNFGTKTCEAAKTCSASAPAPDACSYGQYCNNGTCDEVAVPTSACPNFGSGGHAQNWPGATQGPVIYSITKVSVTTDANFCGAGSPARFKIHVMAYDPAGSFTSNDKSVVEPKLHYVLTNGNEGSSANTTQAIQASNGGKNVEFDMNFCRPAGSTQLVVGLHFLDGNEACSEIQ
jgi:hypothetical protein